MSMSGPPAESTRAEVDELLSLFKAALDVPDERRAAWLDTLDAARSHLKPTVLALLRRHAAHETEDHLERLVHDTLAEQAAQAVAGTQIPTVGNLIGPYRLLSPLGEGGMSSVWLAERDDGVMRRKVALKLPHWWALAKLSERAIQEREILASLQHPNIARLYDAGITSDGRPYLALEYIDGQPIDRYCREHALDTRQRVALLIQVVRAVAYAHAQLVVHRDLKPSNILVDREGQVHLLDFGIAKLLEESGAANRAQTQLGTRLFTPEYASPEQLSGAPVLTSSDVYSLGAVLFELLTDEPLRAEAPTTIDSRPAGPGARTPSDVLRDPARARALRGDLDTIVLKALKTQPHERYATAVEFADDLQRYLDGEPVRARPDSTAYRLRKFVQRNLLAVAAASAVVLSLAIGLAVAAWQLQVARSEKRRAEDVKDFVASIFRSADPFFTGNEQMTAAELLTFAKQRIDKEMAAQPLSSVELLAVVGEAQANLQQRAAARETLEAAVARAERDLPEGDVHAAHALAQLAALDVLDHDYDNAQRRFDAALPQLRAYGPPAARALVNALLARGFMLADLGERDRGVAVSEEAVRIANEQLGEADSETILAVRQLAQEYHGAGRLDDAVRTARDAYERALAEFGSGGRNGLLVETEDMYGRALFDAGQRTDGIAHMQSAITNAAVVFGAESVATKRSWLARAQLRLGDLPAAAATLRSAVSEMPEGLDRARLRSSLGVVLTAARQPDAAIAELLPAVAQLEQDAADPWLHNARATLGHALAFDGRLEDARTVLQRNLQPAPVQGNPLADTYSGLAMLSAFCNAALAESVRREIVRALSTSARGRTSAEGSATRSLA